MAAPFPPSSALVVASLTLVAIGCRQRESSVPAASAVQADRPFADEEAHCVSAMLTYLRSQYANLSPAWEANHVFVIAANTRAVTARVDRFNKLPNALIQRFNSLNARSFAIPPEMRLGPLAKFVERGAGHSQPSDETSDIFIARPAILGGDAMGWVSFTCGVTCGRSQFFFLKKRDSNWAVVGAEVDSVF